LVPRHCGDDLKADAFGLLKKLRMRSFIGSDDIYLSWFRVHDVMKDLAFYVLENDNGTPLAKELFHYQVG
jgi:hypothetical protein